MTDPLGAAAVGGRTRLNIGEVLDLLRPDFPGVTPRAEISMQLVRTGFGNWMT